MISHETIEKNLGLLIVLTILIVSVGGLVQIVPLFFQTSTTTPVAGEFVYDRPFLWGSKRTGPDLHRVGGRYSDTWHVAHLLNPRDVVPESIMPAYPWLDRPLKDAAIQSKMRTLNFVGHGYSEQEIAAAPAELEGKTEMDAVVAYLQVLGIHAPKN